MAGMMWAHPWLLVFTIAPNIVTAAIAPIQAWLVKEVLNGVTKGEQEFLIVELLPYIPWAVGIFAGLGLLQLMEKVSNRMFDDRLLIDTQRYWFERRTQACAGEQVARATNDCKNVMKLFDLAQKEFWVAVVGVPAVLIWQLKLSAGLLPALLFTALIPFLTSLLFGAILQRLSHRSVLLVAHVSSAVAQGDKARLHEEQEKLYANRVRFEVFKQSSEVISEFAFWMALALLLLLSWSGLWNLLPEALTAAEIAAFLVNLKLINKPLNALTKMHNKVRESWPSVRRVLCPQEPEIMQPAP
jgi:ABC-type multidrug transport system fused ATPase/permease subunit